MRIFQKIVLFLLLIFTSCHNSKEATRTSVSNFEKDASFELDQVYFQKWIAGVQGGGSGIHMYILVKTNKNHVGFESVYFRGMQAKIQLGKMGYIASFKTPLNQKQDMVMDSDSQQEYGNKLPEQDVIKRFNLEENECIIQYVENKQTKYYKVSNIVEKQSEYYPSTPPNKEKQ